jgi:hypothetical protein
MDIETKNHIVVASSVTPTKTLDFDYRHYFNSNINLNAFKIPELKQIAKCHKLHVGGTKPVLVNRIHHYFISHTSSVMIQKRIRGRFVRKFMSILLRGIAFKERSLCVNETDFYTMEPIIDVPFQQFFSFTDEKQFTYGFDIHSLMTMYRKKGKIMNPYNRDHVSDDIHKNVFLLYRLIRILFPTHVLEEDIEYNSTFANVPRRRARQRRTIATATQDQNVGASASASANEHMTINTFHLTRYQTISINYLTNYVSENPSTTDIIQTITQIETKSQFMMQLREKETELRIREVFMEMDQLGNYTDWQWMTNLTLSSLHTFYRNLMEIWRFRAQLSFETKHRISPIEDPFLTINHRINNEFDLDVIRRQCLNAMENLIFSGFDVEFRKLGAMHVITALTVVSPPARTTFFWLYESMF